MAEVARGECQDAALVEAFNAFARQSRHATMQGFMDAFRGNVAFFIEAVRARPELGNLSTLAFQSISYIYRHWTAKARNLNGMEAMTAEMIALGCNLAANFRNARAGVARHFRQIVRGGEKAVVFGRAELVRFALVDAAKRGVPVAAVVLEGRPACDGYRLCRELREEGVECELALDCQLAAALARADFALVGAEAVTENGGVIAAAGTATLALCARALRKPFYALAENFKLSRMFALCDSDLPSEVRGEREVDAFPGFEAAPENFPFRAATCDFTPPQHINFIVTDAKILTPVAVSDELLHMYSR